MQFYTTLLAWILQSVTYLRPIVNELTLLLLQPLLNLVRIMRQLLVLS